MFTWSLEVDPAELHGVGGMVGRHGFAAGKTALPALGFGPFPGTKQPHDKVYFSAIKKCKRKYNLAILGKLLESPIRLLGESKQDRSYCKSRST